MLRKRNRGGSPIKQANTPETIERGYITIPYNIDKDEYMETCYRTGTISVVTDGGSLRNNVLITNEAIQNISFPKEPGQEGTEVMLASSPYRTNPVVIGTIFGQNDSPAWSKNMNRFLKINEKTSVCIETSAETKSIDIIVNSEEKVNINIIAVGTEESELKLQSSGKVKVVADKEIEAISYNTISVKVIDPEVEAEEPGKEERSILIDLKSMVYTWKTEEGTSLIQVDKDNIKVSYKDEEEQLILKENLISIKTGEKVEINGAKEPLTLADTLIQKVDQVQKNIDTLKSAWQTAAGAAVPQDGGKAGLSAGAGAVSGVAKVDFSDIKSTVIFSD